MNEDVVWPHHVNRCKWCDRSVDIPGTYCLLSMLSYFQCCWLGRSFGFPQFMAGFFRAGVYRSLAK